MPEPILMIYTQTVLVGLPVKEVLKRIVRTVVIGQRMVYLVLWEKVILLNFLTVRKSKFLKWLRQKNDN